MNEVHPNHPPVPASNLEQLFLFSGFLLTGVMGVLLGPLIPVLEATWHIDHSQSASLFLVQFSASSIGAIVSSFNLRRSLVWGYALSALALYGLAVGGWPLARVFMALSGFSLGLVISGSNLIVARKNPENRGSALSTLNLVWGVGAVTSPLLFAIFAENVGAFGLLKILGLLAAVTSLALALKLRNPVSGTANANDIDFAAAPRASTPLLLLVAALLFFYVGSEISIGGWLVALSDQFSADRSIISLIIGSGFWGAILLGRATAAIALRRLSETTVYSASLCVAGIGTVLLFLADSRGAVALGATLAGLGLAALFPLTISILTAVTVSNRSHVAGFILACGGLGGALLPWLTGRLSDVSEAGPTGSLSRGFLVPIAGLAILSTLFAVYRMTTRASRSAVS